METIEILKKKFVDCVIEHAHLIEKGEGKKANRIHKKIHSLYLNIIELGRVDIFKDFLKYEDENIRLWSAGFLLKAEPKLAEKELKKLKKSSNFFIRTDAEVTLKLYHNNEWDKLLV